MLHLRMKFGNLPCAASAMTRGSRGAVWVGSRRPQIVITSMGRTPSHGSRASRCDPMPIHVRPVGPCRSRQGPDPRQRPEGWSAMTQSGPMRPAHTAGSAPTVARLLSAYPPTTRATARSRRGMLHSQRCSSDPANSSPERIHFPGSRTLSVTPTHPRQPQPSSSGLTCGASLVSTRSEIADSCRSECSRGVHVPESGRDILEE